MSCILSVTISSCLQVVLQIVYFYFLLHTTLWGTKVLAVKRKDQTRNKSSRSTLAALCLLFVTMHSVGNHPFLASSAKKHLRCAFGLQLAVLLFIFYLLPYGENITPRQFRFLPGCVLMLLVLLARPRLLDPLMPGCCWVSLFG
ncbi:hypothetical protein BX070DRAFT_10929 [Coemansia spiralis]|nr:hypothetical protein BX070DRAFT_10929 [Coemansia spiralis]